MVAVGPPRHAPRPRRHGTNETAGWDKDRVVVGSLHFGNDRAFLPLDQTRRVLTTTTSVADFVANPRNSRLRFGARLGFGRHPALVIVDLSNAFTDPDSRLGSDLDDVVQATRMLLDAFRERQFPVVFITTAYHPGFADAGLWISKIPAAAENLVGTKGVEIDVRLARRNDEILLIKKFASGFAGTGLASLLTSLGCDTAVVCGCSTSACIRATVQDALTHGFRPIVPRECVGDRAPGPHLWNLFDIDAKFGDVMSLTEVQAALVRASETRAK